jgi:hypothetical protein
MYTPGHTLGWGAAGFLSNHSGEKPPGLGSAVEESNNLRLLKGLTPRGSQ